MPKQYILISCSSHIYMGQILKNSDYELSWIMQRNLCTNTYQFHFFVLLVIFMPNPTAPYLCSQLASVTKGLCKQLLLANRFLPTSEEAASYAASICPPGMHKITSPFFFFTCFNTAFGRKEEKQKQKENKHKPGTLILYSMYRQPLCIQPNAEVRTTVLSPKQSAVVAVSLENGC